MRRGGPPWRARDDEAGGRRRPPFAGPHAPGGPPGAGGDPDDPDARPLPGLLRWLPSRDRLPWRSTLFLTLFMIVGTHGASRGSDRVGAFPGTLGFLLAAAVLLLLRHRHPRTAAFGTAAVCLGYLAAGLPYGPIFLSAAVACFAAVSVGERHAAWGALALLFAGHVTYTSLLYRWLPPGGDDGGHWGQVLFVAAWAAAVLAGGELMRTRREQWAALRAEREQARRRRADEERLRIARELHDVLAHSISVINIQAGVGLALLDQQPEKAREALTTIKSASKEALGEVRQVLDALRTPGGAPRSPAPGLDRLGELREQAAAAGLTVDVTVDGTRVPLPPGTELAAFRIVQEALTNVVRHSGSRTARVVVAYAPAELELQVDDDGPATAGGLTGGGNGLVGMRERAAALGGTVEAGTRPDGGFRVRARIPLPADTVNAGREPRGRDIPEERQ
ncbi:sensor histidine kinase [Streptomyces sp. MAR4 CNX-425]|uniref:sensor histidine kinase n=1 Tax=Streptomyces sp. MAR4 CNX-425 TaxID=3406343 RepID=UPI003B511B75